MKLGPAQREMEVCEVVGLPVVMSEEEELRTAVWDLSSRCLTQSAKWCAELLDCAVRRNELGGGDGSTSQEQVPTSQHAESNRVRLARLYLENKEFDRCAWYLESCADQKELFIRCYAKYLAGEKRREEATMGGEDNPPNEQLMGLKEELNRGWNREELDAFCAYLLGVVLKALGLRRDAVAAFKSSVTQYPLHWGSWVELASLMDEKEDVDRLELPDHWMRDFFHAQMALEFQDYEDCRNRYTALEKKFPTSAFLLNQMATALYRMGKFDSSQKLFEVIFSTDPYRLEGIDTFSDILYVREQRADLSSLAQRCVKIDKFRPETCCVIGNYLSLREDHEKAVQYFQRALRLNRSYLSAWTLMGHEYVEMKNTSAAIEAYRKAVDIDQRDYRAWYGLGQTYELLNMPFYALYYFRKAAAVRPRDPRMWSALGYCYEELRRDEEAITCWERASKCNESEGIALRRLCGLYKRTGRHQQAEKACRELVHKWFEEGGDVTEELGDALCLLAEQHLAIGEVQEAYEYGERLLDMPVPDRVRASALLARVKEHIVRLRSQSS